MNRRNFFKTLLGAAGAALIGVKAETSKAEIVDVVAPMFDISITKEPAVFEGLDAHIRPGWAPRSSYFDYLIHLDDHELYSTIFPEDE